MYVAFCVFLALWIGPAVLMGVGLVGAMARQAWVERRR